MKDMRLDFEAELNGLDADDWFDRIDAISDEHGYFEPLGDKHVAAFLDAGPNLMVTFEDADYIRKFNDGDAPRGFRYAQREGWSHLAIIAKSESWFRDPAIYRYFDRLIDDGFFEDFDNVLFYGTHGGAYAAAAYSVAAPGCTVLALRPQATLDPRIAGWDTRYVQQRRHDFTHRFGYAPDMIDAVNHAYIAFDPLQRFDAMHAGMFTRSNVTALRCTGLGNRLDLTLDAMEVHDDLIKGAMFKTLDLDTFNKAMRKRRDNPTYLRNLYTRMIQTGHPKLAANVCAYVLRSGDQAFFARKLEELVSQGHHPSTPLSVSAA
ncbi:MAG: hypothetical protein ACJAXK_000819 [Yoonia sp.]|jgi:hypothetical protein